MTEPHSCLLTYRVEHAYVLGGIAQAGCFFVALDGSSTSGGTSVPEDAYHRLAEGGVFIDERSFDTARLLQVTRTGPLFDPRLGPRETRGEHMGVEVYCEWFYDLGARVGRRRGNQMHWQVKGRPDEVEDIRPCPCWRDVCLGCHRLRHYVDSDTSSFIAKAREPSGPNDHCPDCRRKPPLEYLAEHLHPLEK